MLVRFSRRPVTAASVAALGLIAVVMSPFAATHQARAAVALDALPVQGDRARAEGFDVLVVSYRTRADRRTGRTSPQPMPRWPRA